jgi:RNA polymerase sigma-B factor
LYLHKDSLVIRYCKNKSPELREKILLSYKPLVEYIAKKLAYNKDDLEDLIQVGSIGLLRSLERFEPSKEIDFSTFATPNIIGEIKHYFRDKSRLVKVPRKLQELYSKIKTYMRAAQKDGETPTVSDIANALDVPEERVLEAIEGGQTSMVLSLDSPTYKSNSYKSADSSPSLIDSLGVEGKEDDMLKKETLKQAINHLPPREKKIVYLRYYSGLSQMEIAKRMNLSQMHISRILTKSIKLLRSVLDPKTFEVSG